VETALFDGEIVAFKEGRPGFSTLKDAIASGGDMTFFDLVLLNLDGEDLTDLTNLARKQRLQPLIDGKDPRVQYSERIAGQGEPLFETMCK
ncbi:hypothetical protein PCJ40_28120, partial [Klebsiella pneumoniae]|uniref:hypothetical protein n=1 Tax=Klebsiella pneumoniae TaxID=573 RepID=UPI0023AF46F2